ncbi:MAG: hypothetical protein FJZ01_12510 [Candidatus Sericytochromatia bacterium]|nr:hypothetical protein [Candidatus Tanganyikabacteria bacterium]
MAEDTVLATPEEGTDIPAEGASPDVRFKGWRGGLLIALPAAEPWEAVREALDARLALARDFWDGAPATLDLGNRDLDGAEFEALCDHLQEAYGLEPAGVVAASAALRDCAASRGLDTFEELPARPPKPEPPNPREQTRYLKGTVRSGTVMESAGNLVIVGDVNAGSELRAAGDIVVMGTLRGVAHAGYGGDLTAQILAINLRPTQLRIGDLIARAPDGNQPPLSKFPEKATVENGEIHVLPL